MNPAVTLAFARLGHVGRWDAVFYPLAQFAGGVLGVALMAKLLGPLLAHPAVDFVVTKPGPLGGAAALAAELALSFGLMLVVVQTTTRPRLMPWTGVFAGAVVTLWITVEAPISGMSINPARTFATAVVAGEWTGWWIYFVAPPLGMLAAVELSRALGRAQGGCAKLHHPDDVRCIFCGQTGGPAEPRAPTGPEAGTFPSESALSAVNPGS
jgi:aquaporin Z